MRALRSPTVFRMFRSLGSSLMIFSYSLMAFCSLPCCTAFSAAASTFVLLNPNPRAIARLLPELYSSCTLPMLYETCIGQKTARPAELSQARHSLEVAVSYHRLKLEPKQRVAK